MRFRAWLAGGIVGGLLLPAFSAMAEDGWQFRVTPYLWVPSLYADMAIGGNPPVESDTSLMDVLDFAILLNGEARKGDWAVVGEFNYLALSEDASSPGGALSAEMSLDGVMGGAALAYRFFSDEKATADAFGGFRAWSLKAKIDFNGIADASKTSTWIDPIVGLRGSYDLSPDIFIDGLGEIGGFGIGSDFQWEVIGRIGYRFNEAVNAVVGYRHLDLDLKDGSLVLDAAMTGPFIAIDFSF